MLVNYNTSVSNFALNSRHPRTNSQIRLGFRVERNAHNLPDMTMTKGWLASRFRIWFTNLLLILQKLPMHKTLLSATLAISTAIALVACGGGSEHICGEKSQSFGVAFDSQTFNIKLGQAAELKSIVTPESCRFDITFSQKGGLPTGMTLVNGNVVGTPTAAGTYQFQVLIDAISGYQPVSSFLGPRSSLITVTVPPPTKPAL